MLRKNKEKEIRSDRPEVIIKRKANWQRFDPKQNKKNDRIKTRTSSNESILDRFLNLFDFSINHDPRIFFSFFAILFIGVIAVYSSSIVFAYNLYDDRFHSVINHVKFIGIGTFFLLVCYFIKPKVILKLWFIPLFISVILLAYLFIAAYLGKGNAIDGANRWIELAGFQFQPSDFAKLSFIIFISAFLGKRVGTYKTFKEYFKENLLPFSSWLFLIILLILLGKNLGTAMVVGFIGMACYAASSVTKYHKTGLLILLTFMVVAGGTVGFIERYRYKRIEVWYNYVKTGDTLLNGSRSDDSYQFDQVLLAMSSGGSTGIGIGKSIGKYYFVKTSAADDSIIGIIAEELGFYMTSLLILLYLFLIFRCIEVANEFSNQPEYYYILIGSSSWIGFQMFLHVGANVGIVPLTGQTLPFISIGGSSLISLMGAMGLILNVSKQKRLH